jgi:hypothetical protein
MRAAARAEGASRDTIRRRQDGKLSKPEWPLGTPRYRFASLNLRRPRLARTPMLLEIRQESDR